MPGSPREADRTAYNLTEAAGGDATEAARRAAGMAQEAVPTPQIQGVEDIATTLGDAFQPVQRIVSGPPTPESIQSLISVVEGLDEAQRQVIVRNLPPAWKAILAGLGG